MKASKKARVRLERRQRAYDEEFNSLPPYKQEDFREAYHRAGSLKK